MYSKSGTGTIHLWQIRYRHKYQDTSRRMTGFFTLMSHWRWAGLILNLIERNLDIVLLDTQKIVSYRGSVLKLIYHNLIIFCVLYALLSVLYRAVLLNRAEQRQREVFELLCIYAARFQSYIPLNFLIGFYVQQVLSLPLQGLCFGVVMRCTTYFARIYLLKSLWNIGAPSKEKMF